MLNKITALFLGCCIHLVFAEPSTPPQNQIQHNQPALTVSTVLPRLQSLTQTLTTTGDIVAKEIAVVAAQINGLNLNQILVDVGDRVTQGQLLATYDGRSVAYDVAQAVATLKQATVEETQAKSHAKRAKKLGKNSAMSQIERDNFLFQAQQAQARVVAAKAALDNQQLRASYTQVRAPVAGLVIDRPALLGSIGHLGMPLFTLIVDNELEWLAKVPINQLSRLTKALPVQIHLPAATDKHSLKLSGKIRRIEPVINQQTRQGTVRVTIDSHPLLRQGMFVNGHFILGEKRQLTLPVTCLKQQDGYHYVFILEKNHKVRKQKVTVEQLAGNRVSILSGITLNDQIVSTGVGFLNHGDRVNVTD